MQTTERPPASPAPSRGPTPARGVVLVAVAVVVGFFLLRAMDDTGTGTVEVDDASPDTTAAPEAEEGAGEEGGEGAEAAPPEEEPAPPPARPPAEVVVLVANGSGVQGAAAQQAEALQGGGYQIATPTNAPAPVETTQVLAVAGFEAEAAELAAMIGAPEGAVAPMPDPPPLDLAGANLLVLLGTDLAGPG